LLEAPEHVQTSVEENGNLFGGDMLERLKALKEKSPKGPPAPVPKELARFEDYGSDEEDDDQ
jgi:hypothetical protein